MNTIAPVLLTLFLSAGPAASPENTVLTELVTKGVAMPDGTVSPLPEPRMPDGLTPAQEVAALTKVTMDSKDPTVKGNVKGFLANSSSVPILMRLTKRPYASNGNDVIRTIEVCFVVYGDWDVLTNKQFSDGLFKESKANNKGNNDTEVTKSGYLKPPALLVRGLSARSTDDFKEYFLYTTIKLFSQVEISVTRFGMATKTPTGVVVAASVDPRFAIDGKEKENEYPNQWRPIVRNAAGVPVAQDPPQPYSGAGFYAKVTRLAAPANAIFVEYHSTFYEPAAWFDSDKTLPNQLRNIIPFQVKQFRIKLAKATEDAAKAKAAGEAPAETEKSAAAKSE